MWGILFAIVSGVIGAVVTIGKEGVRQAKSGNEWTEEEVNQVKPAYIFGWRLMGVVLTLAGAGLIGYWYYLGDPAHIKGVSDVAVIRGICFQGGGAILTYGILAFAVLLCARKNPKVYRLICMSKAQKEIRPNLTQKVAKGMEEMLGGILNEEPGEKNVDSCAKYKDISENRLRK